MKKFFLAFAAVAALFAACSKENPANEESNIPEESTAKVYTLTATMPATKATVDESTGKFEWESTDKIAVYDKAQSRYQVFTSTGSGSSVTFSFTATDGLSHDFSGSDPHYKDALYPVSRIDANGIETLQGIVIDSAGDVPMTATYNGGTLEFAYDAAVVKLTVKNVPSFTGIVQLVIDGAAYDAEVNHSVNEDMTFYMIVNESTSAASEINLFDTAGNKFITKSFKLAGGHVVKGALIPLKTTVGPVVLIKNNTLAEATAGNHASSGMPGAIDYYTYLDSFNSGAFNDDVLHSISISGNDYVYYVYPASEYGHTVNVIVHHNDYNYPRVETAINLDSYERIYNFGYTTGLRRADRTGYTFYVYSQNRTNVDLYVKSPSELFGTWSSPLTYLKGFIQTGDDDSANRIYYFDLTGITTYTFQLHNGDTLYSNEETDITVNGNVYWAVYSNSGGTWNYDAGITDANLPNWIYTW